MSSENFKDLINNSDDITARKLNQLVKEFEEFRKLAEEKTKNKAVDQLIEMKTNQMIKEKETKSLPPAIKYD